MVVGVESRAVQTIVIDLHISVQELEKLYSGSATNVLAYARDGRRVQFPAAQLRRFTTREGVNGRFVLSVDENNKLLAITRA